jgi:RimJ/RimL family protein N-acetyltransferase
MTVLNSPRLQLRPWRQSDLAPFAALNADPGAMEFMPQCLSQAQSDDFARHAQAALVERGWGLWAVQLHSSGEFLGCVGLSVPSYTTHFTPCIAADWRLKRACWGHGYATEAARESLRFAFEKLAVPRVVSFTVPANLRSRAVMERLGMTRDPGEDFEHPKLPPGHPLRPHVLYRLAKPCDFVGSAVAS